MNNYVTGRNETRLLDVAEESPMQDIYRFSGAVSVFGNATFKNKVLEQHGTLLLCRRSFMH